MKKAIFTALVGGYDNLKQPSIIDKSFDYILFTNDIIEKQIGIWQIRKIAYTNKDNTRIARWVKTHADELFPEYDYAVWIDSNVIINQNGAYEKFNTLFSNNIDISSFAHWGRDCIYEECFIVWMEWVEKMRNMLPEMKYLKKQGYPFHNGLCETNCVFFNLQNKVVSTICRDWWWMIDNFSKRDQLSFNYVLWKNKASFEYLLPIGFTSRNHQWFIYIDHAKNRYGSLYYKWKKYGYRRCKPILRRLYYLLLKII